jgi:hypothetical protein
MTAAIAWTALMTDVVGRPPFDCFVADLRQWLALSTVALSLHLQRGAGVLDVPCSLYSLKDLYRAFIALLLPSSASHVRYLTPRARHCFALPRGGPLQSSMMKLSQLNHYTDEG